MILTDELRKKMAETVHAVTMPAIAVGAISILPEDELVELYDEATEKRIAESGEGAPEFPGNSYANALHETYLMSGGLQFRK